MSRSRTNKASRHIPEHVKRAVNARDGHRCRNCGVVTEFIHHDHIYPYDLGGPTTVSNIQSLCPTCNTSKGNKITCKNCGHWMSPDKSHCTQCGERLAGAKRSNTLAGKLENLFNRVGRVVVLAGAAIALLVVLIGGIYIVRYFRGGAGADQAAFVNAIVNTSFAVSPQQPASFKIVIPDTAQNARLVGGFKVTSGSSVNFFILSEEQFGQWSNGSLDIDSLYKRERIGSTKVRQAVQPGTYYLLFAIPDGAKTVAAEFYAKYD